MPIISLPGANPSLPEHKIGVFVLFCPPEPLFPGISSTKSVFLCFFALRNPRFRAFRAQNRGFCALLASGTLIFGHFEHKIGIFVRFGGATAGATARSNGSNGSNRSNRSNGSNGSNWSKESTGAMEQQERRPGQFGLLTFCHKGALFELWHSI